MLFFIVSFSASQVIVYESTAYWSLYTDVIWKKPNGSSLFN